MIYLRRFLVFLDLGLRFLAEAESVLPGPKGNRERFLLLERP